MKRILAGSFALLVLAGTTLAQQAPASGMESPPIKGFLRAPQLTGRLGAAVTDSADRAVQGALIRAVHMKTNAVHYATTDAEGRFALENLPAGNYSVKITKLDYEPLEVSNLNVGSWRAARRQFVLEPIFRFCAVTDGAQGVESKPESSIKNFFRVNEQVCTGGQPTMEELEKLKAEGVKSIINLRMPGEYNIEEETSKAKALGLHYFHIPFNNNEPKDEAVDEFLKVMADKQNLPVFIHCTTANRVGGFWLIRRVLVDGWTVEKAEEEAKKVGLHNPKTRDFALGYISRHQKTGG